MSRIQQIRAELAELVVEIDNTTTHLRKLRERRDKLRKIVSDGRTEELRGSDSHIVLISELRPRIKNWIDLYDRQYGKGGQLMLAERSTVSTRRIRAIVNGTDYGGREAKFVSLQTADRLLSAIGQSVADVEVFRNTQVVRATVPDPPFHHFEED